MAVDRSRPSSRSIRVYPEYAENRKGSSECLSGDNDENQDHDSDSHSVSFTFPPHAESLIPIRSWFGRSEPSPNYRSARLRSRGYKLKCSCRSLRMPALVLLCTTAIVSFILVPWHHSRSGFDLNRLRILENDVDAFAIHSLSAPDGSIYGSFIGLGASVQSLFVKDRHGSFRDVVLGYDNTSEYLHHPTNPRFGSVVGRYANRIKNSSFALPGRPAYVYRTTPNEHDGLNTLHGGTPGWDRRPFKVESKNQSHISFSLVDYDGEQGFPGRVESKIEYGLQSGGRWTIKMTAKADRNTPLMLSSHVYWNLDAYFLDEPASKHFLQINASNYIPVDAILIPTGKIEPVSQTPLDFTHPVQIGARLNETVGLCGQGCIGYDNAWVYDPARPLNEPVMYMWSNQSGIKISVMTDQAGVQVYSCNGIVPGDKSLKPISRKKSQAGPDATYENHSCVVIEQQGLIDAINNPEWKVNSIYGPGRTYEWNAVYEFSSI